MRSDAALLTGSPPRMRGELQALLDSSDAKRITPAYAGRTIFAIWGGRDIEDHPRVCGENLFQMLAKAWAGGSPPRMRGELADGRDVGALERITPAYAGRTRGCPRSSAGGSDHPRVCGENYRPWVRGVRGEPAVGSPPRMRGERPTLSDGVPHRRITPAYAGRTRHERSSR